MTRRSSLRWALKHSTPAGAALSWHSGLQGDVPSHQERGPAGRSPRPARSSWDLLSSPGGVSLMASFRKRRLSTIKASEVSSEQLGSNSDPFAFEEDPPVPASVTQQQQQGKSPPARRSPPNLGLPGIPDTARRRPRDLKRLAAMVGRNPSPSPRAWSPCPRPPLEGSLVTVERVNAALSSLMGHVLGIMRSPGLKETIQPRALPVPTLPRL